MRPRTYAITALVASAALAGCGGSSEGPNEKSFSNGDQKDVAKVVDDLQAAARAGDTKKICTEIFVPQLSAVIARRAKTTCQAKVAEELPHNETIKVSQVVIAGTSAIATVTEQTGKLTRLTLVKLSGHWKINGIQ